MLIRVKLRSVDICLPFLKTLKATVKKLPGLNCFIFKGTNRVQKSSGFRIFYDSLRFYSHIKKNSKSLTLLFLIGLKVCLFHIQICLVRPHNIMRLRTANCRICSLPFVCKCCPSVLLLFFALCSIKSWGLLGSKITVQRLSGNQVLRHTANSVEQYHTEGQYRTRICSSSWGSMLGFCPEA